MPSCRSIAARFAHRAASAALAAFMATTAIAAPPDALPAAPAAAASAADAIGRFLVDRGLIGAAADTAHAGNALVDRVRDKASEMVLTAMNFLGVRYTRGGNSPETGFDCSGFTREVFESSLGLMLPRRVEQQARASGLVPVKRTDLQPGDLVFFNTLRRTFSHVGIYVGDGKFIHAPKPGGEVRVEDMRFRYWASRFTGARRAEPALEQAADAAPSPPAADATPPTASALP
jgi:cell wall-associated NlpC family hydrolase